MIFVSVLDSIRVAYCLKDFLELSHYKENCTHTKGQGIMKDLFDFEKSQNRNTSADCLILVAPLRTVLKLPKNEHLP